MTISVSARFEILQRDGFRCRYCGKRAPETELEVDHIHARAGGGCDEKDNLITACRDCNRGKGDKRIEPPGLWCSLVGKFFHTFCIGRRINCQGRILESVGNGIYVVEYFEWLTGHADFGSYLVPLRQMARDSWAFYASADEMNDAYEYSGRAHHPDRHCKCRDEKTVPPEES